MPTKSMRFHPPPIDLRREERWVLLKAFAEGPVQAPADPATALAAAQRLSLVERIASRQEPSSLATDLGEEVADQFAQARRQAVALGMRYEQLAEELASMAALLGLPLIFLKGLALQYLEIGPPGRRSFSDLDLLAEPQRASALHGLLLRNGFETGVDRGNDHHLPTLTAPFGGAVDIHFRLRGLRLGGPSGATAQELFEGRHCVRLERCPGQAWAPTRPVLAAHALVHGLDQHGLRPSTYPLMRMIGDLCDLIPDRSSWREFLSGPLSWLEDSIAPSEAVATADLCSALKAGELPPAETDADTLLCHLLACTRDKTYAESLEFDQVSQRLSAKRRSGEVGEYVSGKLWQTRLEIEQRRGRPTGFLACTAYRLWRPFELVGKLLTSALRKRNYRRGSSAATTDNPEDTS